MNLGSKKLHVALLVVSVLTLGVVVPTSADAGRGSSRGNGHHGNAHRNHNHNGYQGQGHNNNNGPYYQLEIDNSEISPQQIAADQQAVIDVEFSFRAPKPKYTALLSFIESSGESESTSYSWQVQNPQNSKNRSVSLSTMWPQFGTVLADGTYSIESEYWLAEVREDAANALALQPLWVALHSFTSAYDVSSEIQVRIHHKPWQFPWWKQSSIVVNFKSVPWWVEAAFYWQHWDAIQSTVSILQNNGDYVHTRVDIKDRVNNDLEVDVASESFELVAIAPASQSVIAGDIYVEWQTNADASDVALQFEIDGVDYSNFVVQTGSTISGVLPQGMLPEGLHTANLLLTGSGGATAETQYQFSTDNIQPELSLISAPELITNDSNISIVWESADANLIAFEVEANGSIYDLDPQSTSFVPNFGWLEGTNSFTISAIDAAGNLSSVTGIVEIDTTGPALLDIQPDTAILQTASYVVEIVVQDQSEISIVDATVTVESLFGSFSTNVVDTVLVTNGTDAQTYVVSVPVADAGIDFRATALVTLEDQFGNTTIVDVPSLLDTQPPHVAILTPTTETQVSDTVDSIVVSGTVNELFFERLEIQGMSVSVDPDGSFSTAVLLESGLNQIVIVATDQTGKQTAKQLAVYRGAITESSFSEPAIKYVAPISYGTLNDTFVSDGLNDFWTVSTDGYDYSLGNGLHVISDPITADSAARPLFFLSTTPVAYPQSFQLTLTASVDESTTGDYVFAMGIGDIQSGDGIALEAVGAAEALTALTGNDVTEVIFMLAQANTSAGVKARIATLPIATLAGLPITLSVEYDLDRKVLGLDVPLFGFSLSMPEVLFDGPQRVFVASQVLNPYNNPSQNPVRDTQVEFTVHEIASNLSLYGPAFQANLAPLFVDGTMFGKGFSQSPGTVYLSDQEVTEILSDSTPLTTLFGQNNINAHAIQIGPDGYSFYSPNTGPALVERLVQTFGIPANFVQLVTSYEPYFVANGSTQDYVRASSIEFSAPYFIDNIDSEETNIGDVVSIGFAATDATGFRCKTEIFDWSNCDSPIFIELNGYGEYTLEVRAKYGSTLGNQTAKQTWYVLDRSIPETILDGNVPSIIYGENVTVNVSSNEPEAIFECLYEGDVEWISCVPNIVLELEDTGVYTIQIRAKDAFNNVDQTPIEVQFSWISPEEVPQVYFVDPITQSSLTEGIVVELGVENAAIVECSLDGEPWTNCDVYGEFENDVLIFDHLPNGEHSLRTRGRDYRGVVQETPSEMQFEIVDTTPPSLFFIETPEPITSVGYSRFIFGSDDSHAGFICQYNEHPEGPCDESVDLSRFPIGEYEITVRAIDHAGNQSLESLTYSWIIESDLCTDGLTQSLPALNFESNYPDEVTLALDATIFHRSVTESCITVAPSIVIGQVNVESSAVKIYKRNNSTWDLLEDIEVEVTSNSVLEPQINLDGLGAGEHFLRFEVIINGIEYELDFTIFIVEQNGIYNSNSFDLRMELISIDSEYYWLGRTPKNSTGIETYSVYATSGQGVNVCIDCESISPNQSGLWLAEMDESQVLQTVGGIPVVLSFSFGASIETLEDVNSYVVHDTTNISLESAYENEMADTIALIEQGITSPSLIVPVAPFEDNTPIDVELLEPATVTEEAGMAEMLAELNEVPPHIALQQNGYDVGLYENVAEEPTSLTLSRVVTPDRGSTGNYRTACKSSGKYHMFMHGLVKLQRRNGKGIERLKHAAVYLIDFNAGDVPDDVIAQTVTDHRGYFRFDCWVDGEAPFGISAPDPYVMVVANRGALKVAYPVGVRSQTFAYRTNHWNNWTGVPSGGNPQARTFTIDQQLGKVTRNAFHIFWWANETYNYVDWRLDADAYTSKKFGSANYKYKYNEKVEIRYPGLAPFQPWYNSSRDRIEVTNSTFAISPNTIAHEMGHFLQHKIAGYFSFDPAWAIKGSNGTHGHPNNCNIKTDRNVAFNEALAELISISTLYNEFSIGTGQTSSRFSTETWAGYAGHSHQNKLDVIERQCPNFMSIRDDKQRDADEKEEYFIMRSLWDIIDSTVRRRSTFAWPDWYLLSPNVYAQIDYVNFDSGDIRSYNNSPMNRVLLALTETMDRPNQIDFFSILRLIKKGKPGMSNTGIDNCIWNDEYQRTLWENGVRFNKGFECVDDSITVPTAAVPKRTKLKNRNSNSSGGCSSNSGGGDFLLIVLVSMSALLVRRRYLRISTGN